MFLLRNAHNGVLVSCIAIEIEKYTESVRITAARGKRKSDAPNATPTVQKRARGNKATRADEGQDKTETKPKRQRKQKEPAEKPTKTRPARTRKKKAAVEPEESSDTDVEEVS